MKGYPVTLVNLETARCVIVGGGRVAARKAIALREAGAHPVVLSPQLCKDLQEQVERGEVKWVQRAYRPGDLADTRLVIAATDDPATNEAVWREAQAVGCLINVVDDPAHCNFYVPATVRRGSLTLSISTGGSSPLLARRIRERLEAQFDAAYEPYLGLLGELRPLVKECIPLAQRKAIWQNLLDSNVLELIRRGESQAARQLAMEIVEAEH